MDIEKEGKVFADDMIKLIKASGINTGLDDPTEAFHSGVYFGIVQGFKKGVNRMLSEAVDRLPDIYNQIVESNHDMSINWKERYIQLLLKECFDLEYEIHRDTRS